MKITLLGEPKSNQTIYRATCQGRFPTTSMTPEGKAIKARPPMGSHQCRGKPFTELHLDNQNKHVLAALNGIIYEDCQIAELRLTRGYDTPNPRIEVSIEPLGTNS